ncbi:MAG: YbjN domain-containing protein [Parvularculaceae bacterium]
MTGIKNIFAGAAAAVMVSGTAIAQAAAQATTALTADEMELVLTEAGLNPTITKDASTGAPVASGKLGQITFWVRALDCSGEPAACATLVFFANFDLGRQITHTDYRIINNFNDKQVFGRAYIIESQAQVGVDYVIELDGGVSRDHVTQNVARWADVVAAFLDNFRSSGAAS